MYENRKFFTVHICLATLKKLQRLTYECPVWYHLLPCTSTMLQATHTATSACDFDAKAVNVTAAACCITYALDYNTLLSYWKLQHE